MQASHDSSNCFQRLMTVLVNGAFLFRTFLCMFALVYVDRMTTDIKIIQLQAGWWLGPGATLGVIMELG